MEKQDDSDEFPKSLKSPTIATEVNMKEIESLEESLSKI